MIRAALAVMAASLFATDAWAAIYINFATGSPIGIGGLLAIVGLIWDAENKTGKKP